MVDKIKSVEEIAEHIVHELCTKLEYCDICDDGDSYASIIDISKEAKKILIKKLTTLLTQRDQQLLDAVVSVLEGLEIVSKPELKMVNPHIQTWEDGYRFALDDAKSAIKKLLDDNK